MKYILILLTTLLFSCTKVKTARFVSTEKPVIILDKTFVNGRYATSYYFNIYLNEFLIVAVNKAMWESHNIGDTIKNVAVVVD